MDESLSFSFSFSLLFFVKKKKGARGGMHTPNEFHFERISVTVIKPANVEVGASKDNFGGFRTRTRLTNEDLLHTPALQV